MTKKSNKKTKSLKGEEKKEKKPVLDGDVKKSIFAVFLIMFALVFLLSLVGKAGMVGEYINKGLALASGWGRYLLPLVMIVLAVMYFRKMEQVRYTLAAVGSILFWVMILGVAHIFKDVEAMSEVAKEGQGGGYIGFGLAYSLDKLLGKIAGVFILLGFSLIGLMLIFNAPLYKFWEGLKIRFRRGKKEVGERPEEKDLQQQEREGEKEIEEAEGVLEEDNIRLETIQYVEGPKDKLKKKEEREFLMAAGSGKKGKKNIYSGSQWKKPLLEDIFDKNKARPHQDNINENIEIIKDTLENFGIAVEPAEHHVGPTVTQYTFKPAVGVKLSRILSLQNDLTLALAADSVRIEAPIPGKSLVGMEVPNKEKSMVRMRSMLESDVYQNKPSKLSIVLGEDVNGYPVLANVEKMPHLLVAGATNTGKSVCINSILCTLLYENSPEDMRLILVDPKRVELSLYSGIPHLLTPVIVDMNKVVRTLKWAVSEMERRYKVLQGMGSRDIQSYNDKVTNGKGGGGEGGEKPEKIPYIIIVIDELADLMAAHGRDVEGLIVRLAQMARAVGIHLVVSTQRPSVEVITGLIKANIITRVAFQVATQIDSRTILDMGGAEKLLGNGDLLYVSAESALPRRVQGIYTSEKEVKKLVKFIKKQAKNQNFGEDEDLSGSLEEQLEGEMGPLSGPGTEGEKDDELYEQAKEVVISAKKASTSMLQRRLSIGYSRAARIIDMLEENGVVGPQEGSKAREVLVATEPDFKKEEVGYEDEEEDQAKRDKFDERE